VKIRVIRGFIEKYTLIKFYLCLLISGERTASVFSGGESRSFYRKNEKKPTRRVIFQVAMTYIDEDESKILKK
jgi:hypothetical protein